MTKSFLITGCAGFIGSHLAKHLVSQQHVVIGIDNFFRGKKENIENLMKEKNFFFYSIDLTLVSAVDQIEKLIHDHQVTVVIHLAAINGTQYFYDLPYFVFDQNVTMTKNLLLAIENTSVRYIIYSSSSEVYGDPALLPTPESEPILLHADFDRDSYAASKAAGDFYIKLFCEKKAISYLILRIFNLYGSHMVGTRYGQVIPEFIQKIKNEDKFMMIGDGRNTRSFCYIDDAIFMIDSLIQKKVTGIINMGNDHEISILKLAELMHDIVGKRFCPIFLPKRPHDHLRRCPNIEKLRASIPELKLTSLEEGLKKLLI